jgi:hypothetical protein
MATAGAFLAGCGSSSSGGAIRVASTPPSSAQAIDGTKANLRNLATAEESYLTDYYDPSTNTGYTTSSSGLVSEGYALEPGTDGDKLVAGIDGDNAYCLIGSPSAGDVWILYDSRSGGIQTTTYTSLSDAESACSDPNITDFQPLTVTAVMTPEPQDSGPTITSAPTADTASNLRNLAVAEEVYLTDFGRYTSDSAGLVREGFTRGAGTGGETILAGADADKGYCLIGGTTASGPWYVYDSQNGGFQSQLFGGRTAAEAACSDPAITDYQPVS